MLARLSTRGPAAIASVLAVAAAGCREEEPELPAACRAGAVEVGQALTAAPREVRLDGTTLSECVDGSTDAADLEAVGGTLVDVATRLAKKARSEPEGAAALQLGYLLGAVRRGAEKTPGTHYDVVKRLEQEAGDLSRRSDAFRTGERAGRASG
jgi:hypothetical protein